MTPADSELSLLEDGVIFLEDPEVGSRVYEFSQKRFPFQTEEGLDFCRTSTLEDKRIRGIVESFFEHSKMGLLKVFGPKQDIVFTFLSNPSDESSEATDETNKGKDKVKALLVQLLPRNSTMVFYKRSHLHFLRAELAKIGLLQVPPESLEREGIKPCEVTMKGGGFAIIDGRTAFTIVNGHTVMVGFAVEEELKFWGKMGFPKKMGIMQKVKGMESEKIGMNVEFVEKRSMNDGIASTTQPQ